MIYFEPTVIGSADCTARFAAKDGGKTFGVCELLQSGDRAEIVSLTLLTDDLSIGEGLLRAALFFAANRGCYIAAFSASGADNVRARLPFLEKNGQWQGDIPTLLTGACGNIDKS